MLKDFLLELGGRAHIAGQSVEERSRNVFEGCCSRYATHNCVLNKLIYILKS